MGAYAHGRLREEQPLCHQTLRSGGYRRRRRCWWWWRCHRWWCHCRRWMMLAALPLKAYRHPARIRPPEIAAELLPALWTSLDAYLAIVHVVIAVYAATSGTGHGYARVHLLALPSRLWNTVAFVELMLQHLVRPAHLVVAASMKNGSSYPGFYVPVTPLTSIPWVAFIVNRRMWVRWEFGWRVCRFSFCNSIGLLDDCYIEILLYNNVIVSVMYSFN